MESGTASWLEHIDMIPTLLKWLLGIISAIGTALCYIILHLGKQFVAKVDGIENQVKVTDVKLDRIHHIMLLCENCSKAAAMYGRRADDLHIGEDDITA